MGMYKDEGKFGYAINTLSLASMYVEIQYCSIGLFSSSFSIESLLGLRYPSMA